MDAPGHCTIPVASPLPAMWPQLRVAARSNADGSVVTFPREALRDDWCMYSRACNWLGYLVVTRATADDNFKLVWTSVDVIEAVSRLHRVVLQLPVDLTDAPAPDDVKRKTSTTTWFGSADASHRLVSRTFAETARRCAADSRLHFTPWQLTWDTPAAEHCVFHWPFANLAAQTRAGRREYETLVGALAPALLDHGLASHHGYDTKQGSLSMGYEHVWEGKNTGPVFCVYSIHVRASLQNQGVARAFFETLAARTPSFYVLGVGNPKLDRIMRQLNVGDGRKARNKGGDWLFQ